MTVRTILYGQRSLSDYGGVVGPQALAALRWSARPLAGLRVLHLSSGRFGGSVSESLASLVPLQRDLGIMAEWQVADTAAMAASRTLNQGLAGLANHWSTRDNNRWHTEAQKLGAGCAASETDVVVVHDPELIEVAQTLGRTGDRPQLIWHCHVDPRDCEPSIWNAIRAALRGFSAVLYPTEATVRADVPVRQVGVAHLGLDPCAPINQPLNPSVVRAVLRRCEIDPDRPLIGQFSPLDERDGAIEALAAYWVARRQVPGLQIALVEPPGEDPDAGPAVDHIAEAIVDHPDIHIIPREMGLGAVEINAIQRGIHVALHMIGANDQTGLAQCLMKGKPAVVASGAPAPWPINDEKDGFIVSGATDAAERITRLITRSGLARRMGTAARERALRETIVTGLLADYIHMFRQVSRRGDNNAAS
jgi:trehalose synthase